MKIFVIPSWYPSVTNPIYGIFVKEQVELMLRHDNELIFGVSLWGQGDDPHLLYSWRFFDSLRKVFNGLNRPYKQGSGRLMHYIHPVYTWTKKIIRGNLKNIINANRANFQKFQADANQVDLIHVHASYPGIWIAQELSKEFSVPYVVTLHMSPFPFKEFLTAKGKMNPSLRERLDKAATVIATSPSLMHQAESLGLQNVELIPNTIDTAFFQLIKSELSQKRKKILGVGRLELQKGFDVLIQAVDQIGGDSEFELEIVGEGSERKNLHEEIKTLGLQHKVILSGEGTRHEVQRKMQECDLFVLSSRHETFGIVLLEAMACGKPVVATRCGGPETIVTSSTGILCTPSDPQSLAKAIEQALVMDWDPIKTRKHVEDNYSPESFTRRMKAVYKKVIAEHS